MFAPSEVARRSCSCTSFLETSAAGMRRSTFSRHYRCTTYCARGYPPSDVPTDLQAYNQVRAAEDLADVVRVVADRSAHIVGLSMGGFAALHFAIRHPRLARSLVLAGVGYGAK